jgi:8-oxo-dGTP diphosphatase
MRSQTMKSKPIRVTAGVIRRRGKILIARRGAGDALAGKWELPGGKIEPRETAAQCLARELKEEFDIDVRVGRKLGSNAHEYPDRIIELIFLEAEYLSGALKLHAHDKAVWVVQANLGRYDFAPADAPFVARLMEGR